MKTLLFTLLLLYLLQAASAQVSGKLTGTNGQPLPFVNVLLLNSTDTTLVRAALTNEQGVYQIENVPPGNYVLRFSSIGYQNWQSLSFEITASQKSRDFGVQVLKESSQQLKEVTVRAEKPLYQQQLYGTVVNVESSVLTKGSSVLEVLERSPGVSIDRRDNNIALNGKNGVTVLINGKAMRISTDQLVAVLEGMSANDIEKIELMTTPPASYDADGSAGIINIVVKKNRNQGFLSLTGGYGWGEKGAASFKIARSMGNTNLHTSYSYSHDKTYMDWLATATDFVPVLGGQTSSTFLSRITPIHNNHNVTFGFDTHLRLKLSVGSSITFNNIHKSERIINHAAYIVEPDSQYVLNADINGSNNWRNLITSAYAEMKMREGELVNFNADYLLYKNNNPTFAYSSFVDKNGNPPISNDTLFSPFQRASSSSTIQVGVVKLDYIRQLNPKLKLETGLKGNFTSNVSQSGIESLVNGAWVSRHTTTNNVLMKEGIGAGYASLNIQLNSSMNLIASARYEYSHTQMDDRQRKQHISERKLGKLFPGIFFSLKLKDRSALQLAYTKRISRPTYNDLASFVVYTDPTSVEMGNPLLRPTITNNLRLGYSIRRYSFSLLLSRDDHPIARHQIVSNQAGDLLVLSPQNLIYQNNLTIQANLPWKVNNWWSMSYSLAGSWKKFKLDYTAKPAEMSYFSYSVNFNESFKLPSSFFLELSGWYNSLAYNGSKKVNGFGAVNGGIKKELKKDLGSLQLAVVDIFKTMRITSYFGSVTEEAFNLKSRVPFSTETTRSPILKLTYSRSFGNGKIKSQRMQGDGSQEERERIRN